MTVQPGANLYTQGFGSYPENVEIPIVSQVDPTTSNVNYPIGKRWINTVANTNWVLTSITAFNGVLTPTWVPSGGTTTDVSTISGNSGTAAPVAGNINILGTANEFTTTASGNNLTIAATDPFRVNNLTVVADATLMNNLVVLGDSTLGGAGTNSSMQGNFNISTASANSDNLTIGASNGAGGINIFAPSNGFNVVSQGNPINIGATGSTNTNLTLGNSGGSSTTTIVSSKDVFVVGGLRLTSTLYTANTTVTDGNCILALNSVVGSFTLIMPAAPLLGEVYYIIDVAAAASTNSINISGNGFLFHREGFAPNSNLIINTDSQFFQVIFTGNAWSVSA